MKTSPTTDVLQHMHIFGSVMTVIVVILIMMKVTHMAVPKTITGMKCAGIVANATLTIQEKNMMPTMMVYATSVDFALVTIHSQPSLLK